MCAVIRYLVLKFCRADLFLLDTPSCSRIWKAERRDTYVCRDSVFSFRVLQG
jgi:hypothetical protein